MSAPGDLTPAIRRGLVWSATDGRGRVIEIGSVKAAMVRRGLAYVDGMATRLTPAGQREGELLAGLSPTVAASP